LANVEVCCEYLAIDNSCNAVSENVKAKAARQVRCKNDEKLTCCYLCVYRQNCGLRCSFLGKMGNESPSAPAEDVIIEESKIEVDTQKSTDGITCSSCKATMQEGKTKLRISGWDDLAQNPYGKDLAASEKEWLPVTVYLCPQCGKLEFAAKEKQSKDS
jgi:hypothetical protein